MLQMNQIFDIEYNHHPLSQCIITNLEDINTHGNILEQAIDSDKQENYDRFIALLNEAKDEHLHKNMVRLI